MLFDEYMGAPGSIREIWKTPRRSWIYGNGSCGVPTRPQFLHDELSVHSQGMDVVVQKRQERRQAVEFSIPWEGINMHDTIKTNGTTTIEILIANGRANIILNAFDRDEQCITLDTDAYAILVEQMAKLSYQDQGHALLSFDSYPNELPVEEEVNENETL